MPYIISDGNNTAIITYDADAENPRAEYDHYATLLAWGVNSPDPNPWDREGPEGFVRDMIVSHLTMQDIMEKLKETGRDYNVGNLDDRYVFILPDEKVVFESRADDEARRRDEVLEQVAEHIAENYRDAPKFLDDTMVLLPLYRLEHSGVSYNTRAFSDPWDSGQVGFAYMTAEDLRLNYLECGVHDDEARVLAADAIRFEVDEYDAYLNGLTYMVKGYEGNTEVECIGGYMYVARQEEDFGKWAIETAAEVVELDKATVKTWGDEMDTLDEDFDIEEFLWEEYGKVNEVPDVPAAHGQVSEMRAALEEVGETPGVKMEEDWDDRRLADEVKQAAQDADEERARAAAADTTAPGERSRLGEPKRAIEGDKPWNRAKMVPQMQQALSGKGRTVTEKPENSRTSLR